MYELSTYTGNGKIDFEVEALHVHNLSREDPYDVWYLIDILHTVMDLFPLCEVFYSPVSCIIDVAKHRKVSCLLWDMSESNLRAPCYSNSQVKDKIPIIQCGYPYFIEYCKKTYNISVIWQPLAKQWNL